MKPIYIFFVLLFLFILFLFWKFTSNQFKKLYGEKMWNTWTTSLFYWQGAIYTCAGITVALIFLMKWGNIISF